VTGSSRRLLYVAPSNVAVAAGYSAVVRVMGRSTKNVVVVRAGTSKDRSKIPTDPLDVRYQVLLHHVRTLEAEREASRNNSLRGLSAGRQATKRPALLRNSFNDLQIANIERGIVEVVMRGLWTKIEGRFVKEVSRVIASSSIVCCTLTWQGPRLFYEEAALLIS
jgi:hypothetical protein